MREVENSGFLCEPEAFSLSSQIARRGAFKVLKTRTQDSRLKDVQTSLVKTNKQKNRFFETFLAWQNIGTVLREIRAL